MGVHSEVLCEQSADPTGVHGPCVPLPTLVVLNEHSAAKLSEDLDDVSALHFLTFRLSLSPASLARVFSEFALRCFKRLATRTDF
jgi:hypothetical protein